MSKMSAPECRGTFRSRQFAPTLAGAVFLSASWCAVCPPVSATDLTEWTGGAKPGFELPLLKSISSSAGSSRGAESNSPASTIQLDDFRDQLVLVHFFATWCEPCVEEMAALNRLAGRYRQCPLTILAISVGEVEARVQNFFARRPVDFPILLDRNREVLKRWQVDSLPTTFVLAPNFQITHVAVGDVNWDDSAIDTLLAKAGAQGGPTTRNQQTTNRGGGLQ